MNLDINQIENYIPAQYVNNSEPDLDEKNLNKAEQALKRVTAAANEAIAALQKLDSAKIDTSKIVNSLAATDTSSVLSGALGPVIDQRLSDLLNKYNQLNGEMIKKAVVALSAPPADIATSYVFTAASTFKITGAIEIPMYAKGIFISSGSDGVLLAVKSDAGLIVAFRNGTVWNAAKIL